MKTYRNYNPNQLSLKSRITARGSLRGLLAFVI